MAARKKLPARPRKTKLLAGGNPQIAMGEGDAPVRAWLAAVPGWKKPIARRLDALVARALPNVRKAVKYNSPLYGLDGRTWLLSLHCFDRYVRVTFFRGADLDPPPAGSSKMPRVRYYDVRETAPLDARQFASWVKQAAALPGEKL